MWNGKLCLKLSSSTVIQNTLTDCNLKWTIDFLLFLIQRVSVQHGKEWWQKNSYSHENDCKQRQITLKRRQSTKFREAEVSFLCKTDNSRLWNWKLVKVRYPELVVADTVFSIEKNRESVFSLKFVTSIFYDMQIIQILFEKYLLCTK